MKFILFFAILLSAPTKASDVRLWESKTDILKDDLHRIEAEAKWEKDTITFEYTRDQSNTVTVNCEASRFHLTVSSVPHEKTSTLYHALFQMGFLFPHPRWQVSPSLSKAQESCGKTFVWRPAFKYRGFHLHTLHPNEWVQGFLMGQTEIATDYVRWLARNRQNLVDVSIMRPQWKRQMRSLKIPFQLAKDFGISRGVSLGVALQQQNSYRLIPILQSLSGIGAEKAMRKSIATLNSHLDYDFMTMEIGTSEFTSTNYEKSLRWMNVAAEILTLEGKKLFTKNHISTDQNSPKYGNFNFLPRFASKEVGLMPHTVHFYGLYDESAPMYGNENFKHMLQFIQEEKDKRAVWYYPETSYWVFLDQDAPLFLTDYLSTRSRDMEGLHDEGVEGHFNFTSGQELGYWLFDWNVALNADLDLNFDSTSALKLLGEDLNVWDRVISFQKKFIKDKELIAIVSFSNLQDELTTHRNHDRNTMKEISRSSFIREDEILQLETALKEVPDLSEIKNVEMRGLLEITELRIRHALEVRKALRFKARTQDRRLTLQAAAAHRNIAQSKMDHLRANFSRYPTARLFDWRSDITSYNFGSLWTAGTLHHWKREEGMVEKNNYNPFFRNIVNPLDIIF